MHHSSASTTSPSRKGVNSNHNGNITVPPHRLGTAVFRALNGRICGLHIKNANVFVLSMVQEPLQVFIGSFKFRGLVDSTKSASCHTAAIAESFISAFEGSATPYLDKSSKHVTTTATASTTEPSVALLAPFGVAAADNSKQGSSAVGEGKSSAPLLTVQGQGGRSVNDDGSRKRNDDDINGEEEEEEGDRQDGFDPNTHPRLRVSFHTFGILHEVTLTLFPCPETSRDPFVWGLVMDLFRVQMKQMRLIGDLQMQQQQQQLYASQPSSPTHPRRPVAKGDYDDEDEDAEEKEMTVMRSRRRDNNNNSHHHHHNGGVSGRIAAQQQWRPNNTSRPSSSSAALSAAARESHQRGAGGQQQGGGTLAGVLPGAMGRHPQHQYHMKPRIGSAAPVRSRQHFGTVAGPQQQQQKISTASGMGGGGTAAGRVPKILTMLPTTEILKTSSITNQTPPAPATTLPPTPHSKQQQMKTTTAIMSTDRHKTNHQLCQEHRSVSSAAGPHIGNQQHQYHAVLPTNVFEPFGI